LRGIFASICSQKVYKTFTICSQFEAFPKIPSEKNSFVQIAQQFTVEFVQNVELSQNS